MASKSMTVDDALDRLAIAARNGNRAKRRLAAKLATLSPEQMRKVAPAVFARLGPDGLRYFAEANQKLSGLAPVVTPAAKQKREPILEKLERAWHFARPLHKCLAVLPIFFALGWFGASISDSVFHLYITPQPQSIDGRPQCERLDRGQVGCVYRTSSTNLSIGKIGAMTGLSPEILVAANPHLDFRFDLPSGALVLIPHVSR